MKPRPGGSRPMKLNIDIDLTPQEARPTQDYALFHVLGDYSIAIWRRQIEFIRRRNGLISSNAIAGLKVEPGG